VKNNVCGVGIAYNSKVAGIRILSGSISDLDEAAALNFQYHNTSIYSCSWGPPDDGRSMESPSYLIERAILNGIQNGRDGRGSIFVFASGNGAAHGDQCNFDGYTNSIYSITIAAIDFKGLHPIYSESCAANLVVAYSSGSGRHIVRSRLLAQLLSLLTEFERSLLTRASLHVPPHTVVLLRQHPMPLGSLLLHFLFGTLSGPRITHDGIDLVFSPDLTWRDMQHLSVRTAEVINGDDPDWDRTSSGRLFSYKYGYGRLNGYNFVTAAREWQLVKPQAWVELPAVQVGNGSSTLTGEMSAGLAIVHDGVTSTITISQEDLDQNNFEVLEHITVRVWITHDRRGDVEVEVISPNGIKSILAARRRDDVNRDGYPAWRFMSVKHW
jgi:kexin